MNDHPIDAMTRADFEQLFSDHTERILKGQEEFRTEVHTRFDEVDDRFDVIERRLDAIEKRTNEETTLALKEVALLKKQVNSLVAHIERTTGEKVKM